MVVPCVPSGWARWGVPAYSMSDQCRLQKGAGKLMGLDEGDNQLRVPLYRPFMVPFRVRTRYSAAQLRGELVILNAPAEGVHKCPHSHTMSA